MKITDKELSDKIKAKIKKEAAISDAVACGFDLPPKKED